MPVDLDQLDADVAGLAARIRAAKNSSGDEQHTAAAELAQALSDLGCQRRTRLLLRAVELADTPPEGLRS